MGVAGHIAHGVMVVTGIENSFGKKAVSQGIHDNLKSIQKPMMPVTCTPVASPPRIADLRPKNPPIACVIKPSNNRHIIRASAVP
jgi:hypothetical protein